MRVLRCLTPTVLCFACVCLLAGCVQEEREPAAAAATVSSPASTAAESDAACPSCCTPLSRAAILRKSASRDTDGVEEEKASEGDDNAKSRKDD